MSDRLQLEGPIPVRVEPDSSDEWYTPPHIFLALGLTFDLDPATIPGGIPWVPARNHYSWKDDGLRQAWHGLVWLNPPYSNPTEWLGRLADHGNGVALVRCDTSTVWWQDQITRADTVCFIRGRLRFMNRHGTAIDKATFPSALAAWGEEATLAVRNADLGWTV